ncbi:MAG: NanQ anomerase/TabA/YiaL family protein [Planctomycetota bacterium]|jgi:YhcH/YjgK/YiaL family protein
MVVDKIENAGLYKGLSEDIAKGLELIKDAGIAAQEDGRYEVDGDNLFYMIQRYPTRNKQDMLFEAHKDYIDIQAIIDGEETIGHALTETLKDVIEPYKPDVVKCSDPQIFTEVKLAKGMFAIFYPDDAHKPCYDYHEGKSNVHKLVVKVRK